MTLTRRVTLKFGMAGLAVVGASTIMPFSARSQENGDTYETENGEITIHPVSHASFVMTTPEMVVYVDPVGGSELYQDYPAPDLILVTHEHGDHYNAETLEALMTADTRLIANPAVYDMMPDDLKANASPMANSDTTTVGGIEIEAIPAYNTTEDRLQYHPEGRDNGYILNVDGRRIYIAGDTEDIPEMRELTDIDIAFLPMNLPYTMTVDQAASAIEAFTPAYVYPYHYRDTDPQEFAALVNKSGVETQVVMGPWYD